MAGSKKQPAELESEDEMIAVDSEEDEEAEEYEVEKIKDHTGIGEEIQYLIKWKGYDKPSDDTWEPVSAVIGCPDIVNKYWRNQPVSKQGDRYAHKPTSSKRSRGSDTPQASASKSSTSKQQNGSSKSTKREMSPDIAVTASGSKRGGSKRGGERKSVVEDSEDEMDDVPASKRGKKGSVEKVKKEAEEEEEEEEDEGLMVPNDVDGKKYKAHEEDYADREDWHDLVSSIDTVERDVNTHEIKFFTVWKEDNSFSWVDNEVAKRKYPLKVIKFYESNLKFTPAED